MYSLQYICSVCLLAYILHHHPKWLTNKVLRLLITEKIFVWLYLYLKLPKLLAIVGILCKYRNTQYCIYIIVNIWYTRDDDGEVSFLNILIWDNDASRDNWFDMNGTITWWEIRAPSFLLLVVCVQYNTKSTKSYYFCCYYFVPCIYYVYSSILGSGDCQLLILFWNFWDSNIVVNAIYTQ